jgi:hypothetical protein
VKSLPFYQTEIFKRIMVAIFQFNLMDNGWLMSAIVWLF